MQLTPEQEKRLLLAALRRKESAKRDQCMDPADLESRPAPHQDLVFQDINNYAIRVLTYGNQAGKSQTGGRELAWLLEDKHPYLKKPERWKNRQFGAIVMARVGEQAESLLWEGKIKPFLTPGTYKEVRVGNSLARVEALDKSWRVLFMSHNDPKAAREKAQGFDYQYVWLDEMPNSVSLIAELQTRIISQQGRMMVTFTPLVRNVEVKEWVENLDPSIGKQYKAGMLDNPIFKGREDEIKAMYSSLPVAEQNTRLYGEWLISDLAVYDFDSGKDLFEKPPGYLYTWPHLFSIDPASSGQTGWAMFAQDPADEQWYVIESGYYRERIPTENVAKAERLCAGKNITRRVADPHEGWFIQQAGSMGYSYLTPWDKNNRKDELIKQLQDVIKDRRVMICDTNEELKRELTSCMYSEKNSGKIVNGSSYHIADAVQYGTDMIPGIRRMERKEEVDPADVLPFNVQRAVDIKKAHRERKRQMALREKMRRGRQKWQRRRY